MSYTGSYEKAYDGLQILFGDGSTRLRNVLIVSAVAGITFFLPIFTDRLQPLALILVIFPAAVIFLAWLQVKFTIENLVVTDRQMPEICLEGEDISVGLTVRYRSLVPFCNAFIQDSFPAVDALESPQVPIHFFELSRTGTARFFYHHRLNRGYGNFIIGPTEIVVRDPFNFFERRRVFPVKSNLSVWLNPPVPEDLNLVKPNALTPMGDSRSSLVGHGMDFYGIKEYVQGDDIRAMSWLKTAQTGKPVIKQFERDSRPDVLVVIHTDRKQLKGFGFGNTMKRLLRIAAAIIGETCQQGLPAAMALCIDHAPHHIRFSSSTPVYGFMTELLGNLEPADEGSLQALIDIALNKAGPGTIVFFLSQTISLPLDHVLNGLLTMTARGAQVCFRAIDDSDQARFSEDTGMGVSKEELLKRLQELDLDFSLLPSRRELNDSSVEL